MNKKVIFNDKMQSGHYFLTEKMGKNFDFRFKPELTPKELLMMGVFGGRYMRDCISEFPKDWFEKAKFAKDKKNFELNYFKVDASLSLQEWNNKGWIHPADPRGWFQWYCRYFYGRRMVDEDERQIKRWCGMKRHVSAIKNNCPPKMLNCRTRQRQALLHWAYDSRNY